MRTQIHLGPGYPHAVPRVAIMAGHDRTLGGLQPFHQTVDYFHQTVDCHPHGGLQPFHQMSTCPDAIDSKAFCGSNLVTPSHLEVLKHSQSTLWIRWGLNFGQLRPARMYM